MVDTDEGVGGPGDAAAVAYSTLHGGFVLQQQNDKDLGGLMLALKHLQCRGNMSCIKSSTSVIHKAKWDV